VENTSHCLLSVSLSLSLSLARIYVHTHARTRRSTQAEMLQAAVLAERIIGCRKSFRKQAIQICITQNHHFRRKDLSSPHVFLFIRQGNYLPRFRCIATLNMLYRIIRNWFRIF